MKSDDLTIQGRYMGTKYTAGLAATNKIVVGGRREVEELGRHQRAVFAAPEEEVELGADGARGRCAEPCAGVLGVETCGVEDRAGDDGVVGTSVPGHQRAWQRSSSSACRPVGFPAASGPAPAMRDASAAGRRR